MSGGQFAEIEARASAATEGPWEVRPESGDWAVISSGPDSVIHAYRDNEPCDSCGDNPGVLEAKVSISIEDAEFIAHAREDIPALLAAVRERDNAIERVRALHQPRVNSTSALYPKPLCACSYEYPCATIAALDPQETPDGRM